MKRLKLQARCAIFELSHLHATLKAIQRIKLHWALTHRIEVGQTAITGCAGEKHIWSSLTWYLRSYTARSRAHSTESLRLCGTYHCAWDVIEMAENHRQRRLWIIRYRDTTQQTIYWKMCCGCGQRVLSYFSLFIRGIFFFAIKLK